MRRLISRAVISASLACVLAIFTNPALAIVNGQEPPVSETRLDAVAAFSFTTWINGVHAEHETYGCGTLIAPDTMILAAHLLPAGYTTNPLPAGTFSFRFRRNIDGSVGSIEEGWKSFHQVSVREFIIPDQTRYGDVIFAKLTTPVTHITPIQFARSGKIAEMVPWVSTVTVAGWGRESPGMEPWPRGRLLFARPLFGGIDCRTIQFAPFFDPTNPCACGVNRNDSGGAVLIGGEQGAPYRLAGLVSTFGGGGLAIPIVEPADPVPSASDLRHDALAAFGPTAWLSEEHHGLPDDGDSFEHEHRFAGVLISPSQVVLPVTAIEMDNPNHVIYSESNPPPAGLFSVRFRRRTDGGVGSVAGGWGSYHQVAVQSFTLDPGPIGTRFIIANLATPVTHIAPMTIAGSRVADNINFASPMTITGWTWGGGTGADIHIRGGSMLNSTCLRITMSDSGGTPLDRCGNDAYDAGAAFVVERSSVVYLEERAAGDFPIERNRGPNGEPVIFLGGPPEGDARFTGEPADNAVPVIVAWFELVALKFPFSSTVGQLMRASQLFDRCFYADCTRVPSPFPPVPPLNKCADVNGDGVLDQADANIIDSHYGPCADCGNCICDLNRDCEVDEQDSRAWSIQVEMGHCPCLADFDHDSDVDEDDRNYLLRRLGPCDCLDPCPADLNGDRVIDDVDLEIFIELSPTICTY